MEMYLVLRKKTFKSLQITNSGPVFSKHLKFDLVVIC